MMINMAVIKGVNHLNNFHFFILKALLIIFLWLMIQSPLKMYEWHFLDAPQMPYNASLDALNKNLQKRKWKKKEKRKWKKKKKWEQRQKAPLFSTQLLCWNHKKTLKDTLPLSYKVLLQGWSIFHGITIRTLSCVIMPGCLWNK